MTDRELMQMALDALIDAADSQNWEMQQNIDQHGEWYRRSVYLKQSTTNSQAAIEALRTRLAQPEPEPQEAIAKWIKANTEHREWYICPKCSHQTPRFKDEWQGLTDEEIREFEIWLDDEEEKHGWNPPADIVKHIETKLKEKNT
jgi:hypothetical protein